MSPFDGIGDALGDKLKELVSSAFDSIMQAVWDASLWILRAAFTLADQFSVFTVDSHSGPIAVLWPMMLWISGVVALGLFFWQLTMTSLRGGRGFLRLVGGPLQYGIALAVTVGMVASFLAAGDGLTHGILEYGLQSSNFQEALQHTTFAHEAVKGIKAVVLGVCAILGVIPAGIGYVLEMLFREAAIYVLVATIPITAAGLLANVTKSWFWKALRWILACIAMKPVLALTLVLGVAIAGGSQGVPGLLAGIGVLLIALFAPFTLFRLFSFVDPSSDAGAAMRDALSSVGVDSYGAGNPAMQAASAALGSGGSGGGSDAQESANTGRFDEAMADYAESEMDANDIGQGSGGSGAAGGSGGNGGRTASARSESSPGSDSGGGSTQTAASAGDSGDAGSVSPPAANAGQVTASDGIGPQGSGGDSGASGDDDGGTDGGGGGGPEPPPPEPPDDSGQGPSGDDGGGNDANGNGGPEPPPPEPPDDGGGGGSPRGGGGGGPTSSGGGGGGSAAAGEAEEAAVIV